MHALRLLTFSFFILYSTSLPFSSSPPFCVGGQHSISNLQSPPPTPTQKGGEEDKGRDVEYKMNKENVEEAEGVHLQRVCGQWLGKRICFHDALVTVPCAV